MCTPQCIGEKLGGLAFDEAVKAGKYVLHYKTNIEKLQAEMRILKHHSEGIEEKVRRANDRGEVVYDAVFQWRTDADKMTCDVQELEAHSNGAVNMSCFGCTCPNIKQRYRVGKEAEEMIARVKELTDQVSHFEEISHARPPPPELEFPSNENYIGFDSRTGIFKTIEDALKDSSCNVIGVHGPGGVGKTTLVQEVGKKLRLDGTFKQVPIAVVSKDFNVKEVQSKLAGRLDFEFNANLDQIGRAKQLWNKFTNGERYLVILDDIWGAVDLNAIGIPIIRDGKTGCKVLLTSRNENLLNRLKVDKSFSIEVLQMQEAWTLFKKVTENSFKDESLAYEVCEKCKGLPVAINALGAALRGEPDHAWRTARDKLAKCMLKEIDGIEPSIWTSLKLSYDMLCSLDNRFCFLLCCLFPDDAEISIDDLTRLCVARDLLSSSPSTLEEARDAVLTVVDALKSAYLVSNGIDEYGIKENFVRIHDVIRDVGISIGRDQEKPFLVDHGARQWPRNAANGPLYSTISINFKDIKGLPDDLVYPQLHTLMLSNSKFSDVEVPDNFFDGMTQLTVLTITRMCMRRLPSSLGKLTNLRMLYLNECELEDIAILRDLKSNLEVLSLRNCSIKALPPDVGLLTRLRVLDLQDCHYLKVIPQGVISNLTSLEEVYFPVVPWCRFTFSFLEELKRSLSTGQLSTLHIHTGDLVEGLKFENLKRFCISTGTRFFRFPWYPGTRVLYLGDVPGECSYLRDDLIPLVDKAEMLYLENFKDLKKLLHDRGVGNEFPHLRCLKVVSSDEMLHPSFLFNNLTELDVVNCKLKYLLSPTTAKGLAHLERLRLEDCEIMEEIVGSEEQIEELTGEVKFSKLKLLALLNLPNLVCFYAKKEKKQTTMESSPTCPQSLFDQQVSLPALNDLQIVGVPKIKKIWDVQPQPESGKDAQHWCKLGEVVVRDCDQLMYVFPCSMLPQLQNLQHLEIKACEEMEVIISSNEVATRNNIIVFPKLGTLLIYSLPNLKTFFEERQLFFSNKVSLPALNDLQIVGVPKIKKIWDVQPQPESGKDAQHWCKLGEVVVRDCDQLMYVFPCSMLPQLQNLQHLEIKACEEMEVIISSNEVATRNNIIVFPKLGTLLIYSLPNLKTFFEERQLFFSNKVSLPALNDLQIVGVPKIKKIWDVQPQPESGKDAQHWCKLGEVVVRDCDQLMYVFPCSMLPQLQNLQHLEIKACEEMEVIISSNEVATRNNIIVFPKLGTLLIYSLPNLKTFFEERQLFFSNKVSLPALYHLQIVGVPKIKKIWDVQPQPESGKDAQHWCKLGEVVVRACDQLMYVFPCSMLPQLQNLQYLKIKACEEMEVIISSNEVATRNNIIVFPKLGTLLIYSLPNLKTFFEERQLFFSNKVSLPALNDLQIVGVPKIKKIWDVQPQPESGKDAQHWCKLGEVVVRDCDQLMYVFPCSMLPQLQNLQHLEIKACEEMEVIISSNEVATRNNIIVFPKLGTLLIYSLPNLKTFFEERQLFFSNKDAFPVLEEIELDEHLKIFRNGTSMKEASVEGCSTSGQKNDCNGEELDKDLETSTKEECGKSGNENKEG